MVTHDQAITNPTLKATIPFVKPPLWVDYGTRLKVASTTFINRNCVILDTPVADLIIGERCNIGTNCTIVCVGRKFSLSPPLSPFSLPPRSRFFSFSLCGVFSSACFPPPPRLPSHVSESSGPGKRELFPRIKVAGTFVSHCCRCIPMGKSMTNKT